MAAPTPQGFVKHDADKPRPALLPPLATLAVARVLERGAAKYSVHNWIKAPTRLRYADAALRHLLAWLAGQDVDDGPGGTGEKHLACAACSILFLLELEERGLAEDDRLRSPK